MMLESGLLDENSDHYSPSQPITNLPIPLTLQDSLAARLDRLADARESSPQLAAALGREFPFKLINAVSSAETSTLLAHLDRLVDSELVQQQGIAPNAVYTLQTRPDPGRGLSFDAEVAPSAISPQDRVGAAGSLRRDRRGPTRDPGPPLQRGFAARRGEQGVARRGREGPAPFGQPRSSSPSRSGSRDAHAGGCDAGARQGRVAPANGARHGIAHGQGPVGS